MIPKSVFVCCIGLALTLVWVLPAVGAEQSVHQILSLPGAYDMDNHWVDYAAYFHTPWGDTQSGGVYDATKWTYATRALAGTWSWAAGDSAAASMVIEWAGWREGNVLGWYNPATYSLTDTNTWGVIFPGTGDAGATKTLAPAGGEGDVHLPATWGFYLDPNGNSSSRFFSEPLRNGGWNSVQEYVRAAWGGGWETSYAFFWEDQKNLTTWNWDMASPNEPDYNDMVVRMDMKGVTPNPSPGEETTPELSAVALLLVGLLPVGIAWRKRRSA